MKKNVLLSFDIEEFDIPQEYKKSLPFEEQIRISINGTELILDLLHQYQIKATFFSTVAFASQAPGILHRIKDEGHELASHGYYHSVFENRHLYESKKELERLSGCRIDGFRMPRMMPVDNKALVEAGYLYNSSLNPTYLPGRYNNFFQPRSLFASNGLIQLPASVTPFIRFPLFWLSFHNLPLWLYKKACVQTINHDNYLNIYFHPWEFADLKDARYGLPGYISKNSGNLMTDRFHAWIVWMKSMNYSFFSISKYLEKVKV
jgi:peptidoglycan/xylan/chitin deacetylase (PgdA/CDA1 family)